MPSCDGSNCGACACDAALERENRKLSNENESLRRRLSRLEAHLEQEVEAAATKRAAEKEATIRAEAQKAAEAKLATEIRPGVEAELRSKIKEEIRPEVEREVKAAFVDKLFD